VLATNLPIKNEISALIVDDESLARMLVRSLVVLESGVEVVGECRDGSSAIRAIRKLRPDLVFLDIQMPIQDGLSVVRELADIDWKPYIIFTTAFDEFAIEAFELNAIDYLVKPINEARFRAALQRARRMIEMRAVAELASKMLEIANNIQHAEPDQTREHRIVLKKHDELRSVPIGDIAWIEAANQYVRIHTADDTYMMSETLSRFEDRLRDPRFVRIHRSTVINCEFIDRVSRKSSGSISVFLKNGPELPVARSRSSMLDTLLLHAESNRQSPAL
jgi:two-component system, LytTR family, response regulator